MRNTVIFLRLGALGDILVSLAALQKVIEDNPADEVVLCGNAIWLQIMRLYPHFKIDRIFILRGKYNLTEHRRENNWESHTGTSFYRLARQSRAVYNLRFESLRYAVMTFVARVPVRFGSSPFFFRFLFTHWYGWLGEEPPIHERDWLLQIVSTPLKKDARFGFVAKNRKILLDKTADFTYEQLNRAPLPEAAVSSHGAEQQLEKYALPAKFILINPTASHPLKAWPAENFRALSGRLAAEILDYRILIIGSPAETSWLQNAAGSLSILQPENLTDLFHIVKRAKALVTNTSSMQFIASTVRTPTMTLMGWAHPVRWGPLGEKNIVVRGKNTEHPDKLRRDGLAYQSITVDEAHRVASLWLRDILF